MELNGFVQNGVIVLTGGASLPEGTPVTVSCGVEPVAPQREKKRVQLPLVRCAYPGNLHLTNAMIGEIFMEEDIEYARRFMGEPPDDDGSWSDQEREALRGEALDELGWEGMEAYQVDEK